jgi:hypothetical protein
LNIRGWMLDARPTLVSGTQPLMFQLHLEVRPPSFIRWEKHCWLLSDYQLLENRPREWFILVSICPLTFLDFYDIIK